MKHPSIILFLFLSLCLPHPAAGLTPEVITQGLQKDPSVYHRVDLGDGLTPVNLDLKLRSGTVRINEVDFDGFRFTAPPQSDQMDWVWYFNVPANWGNWYITPLEGAMTEAFTGSLDADKLYQGLDQAGENGRRRILQTLAGGYFQPGKDYLIWFRKMKEGNENNLRGRLLFVKKGTTWNFDSLEKTLDLKPLPPASQVEQWQSRGGKILLDPSLFDAEYAAGQIDSVFSNMRQSQTLAGGFPVSMEASLPFRKDPTSFKAIRKTYGEPDFVQTSEEKKQVWLNQGYKEYQSRKEGIITYYYDYFGFEVSARDPDEKVVQVVTEATSYAELRPSENGRAFGRIPAKNLTVFYQDKKEVGRIYNFLEDQKIPLCLQEPPPGKYQKNEEYLEYLGKGKWVWSRVHPNGSLDRKIPFVNHLMEGKAEGYSPTGHLLFSASYRRGQLDGEAIEYAADGTVTKKQTFVAGRPLPANLP